MRNCKQRLTTLFIYRLCEVSCFCRKLNEKWALQGCYKTCSGNSLPTFRDNLSVPSSSVKNTGRPEKSWFLLIYLLFHHDLTVFREYLTVLIYIEISRNIWPCGRSASNRNEYQEYFLGGKWLTTLPPSCADCLEIWQPQPSGTLRACPGP